MKDESFVVIVKDAMTREYLPIYGNRQFKTPEMSDLADKGTIFLNHYTAAPSTVMSCFSMFTGLYAHETKYQMYERLHDVFVGDTCFSKLKEQGYSNHIVWDDDWAEMPDYFDYYKDDVVIHNLHGLRQGVGAHYKHDGFLVPDNNKAKFAFDLVKNELDSICKSEEKIFLYIHFPHVINGFVSYGSDIEMFDKFIGLIRKYFLDENIIITADHGNQNGHRGKVGYGYDVFDESIRIPLITGKNFGVKHYDNLTSNIDLYNLINGNVVKREIVYSDTAYKAQRHRKLCIISRGFKYIYDKKNRKEYLYDLIFDPEERFSIMEDYVFDVDRKIMEPSREVYYYPDWLKLDEIRSFFRAEKNKIWKEGSRLVLLKNDLKNLIRPLYLKLHKKK